MIVDINFSNKASNDYKIFINELENITINTKVAIITNPKVAGLHLQTLLSKIKEKILSK